MSIYVNSPQFDISKIKPSDILAFETDDYNLSRSIKNDARAKLRGYFVVTQVDKLYLMVEYFDRIEDMASSKELKITIDFVIEGKIKLNKIDMYNLIDRTLSELKEEEAVLF